MDQFGRVKTYGLVLSPLLPSSSHVPSFHVIFSVNYPINYPLLTFFRGLPAPRQLLVISHVNHGNTCIRIPYQFISIPFLSVRMGQLTFQWVGAGTGRSCKLRRAALGPMGSLETELQKTGFLATSTVWFISFQKGMVNKRCKLLRQCLIYLYLLQNLVYN